MAKRSGYAVSVRRGLHVHVTLSSPLRRTEGRTQERSSSVHIICERLYHGKGKYCLVHHISLNGYEGSWLGVAPYNYRLLPDIRQASAVKGHHQRQDTIAREHRVGAQRTKHELTIKYYRVEKLNSLMLLDKSMPRRHKGKCQRERNASSRGRRSGRIKLISWGAARSCSTRARVETSTGCLSYQSKTLTTVCACSMIRTHDTRTPCLLPNWPLCIQHAEGHNRHGYMLLYLWRCRRQ